MTSSPELRDARTPPPLVTRPDDDPAVLADAASDDYALHVVPPNWRLSRTKLEVAWSATLAALFWVVIAAVGASVVGTRSALIGMAVAFVFYSLISYPIQKAAAHTGATLATFSRSIFGGIGVPIASLIFVISATVLAIFEGSILAVAFQTHFGGSIYLWYGAVAFVCTLITLGGVRVWLEKLNAWLLPVFIAGLVGALVWAIAEFGYQGEWIDTQAADPSGFFGPGWLFVFALYLTGMVNVLYVFDFARMGHRKDIRYNGHVTFGYVYWFLAVMVVGGAGIYLSQSIPVEGVNEAGVVIGIVQMMGIWGVIYIFATQAKIQTANMYLASLNLQIFFSRAAKLHLPRTVWTFVVGVILFAVMCANIFNFLTELLAYQGVFASAWTAVAVVHILHRRTGTLQERFETRPGRVPRINPGGLAGWATGSIVGTIILATGSIFALTYALILTCVVSAVVYGVSLLLAKPGWFSINRPFDPIDEVSVDPWSIHIQCHRCSKSYVAAEMDRDPSENHAAVCASCARGQKFNAAVRLESGSSNLSGQPWP